MSKFASKSNGSKHECQYSWPEDCSVQCGDSGIVLGNGTARRTAFFEAFPKEPKTFIRGEGQTVVDAELSAWHKYQKILNCVNHEFERYKGEIGKCKHCQLTLINYFDPEHICSTCGKEAVNQEYKKKKYCLLHYSEEAIKNGYNPDAESDGLSFNEENDSYLDALCIKALFDCNQLLQEKPEVEQSRWYDDFMSEFSNFKYSKTIEVADGKLIMGEKFIFDHELENATELYGELFNLFLVDKGLIKLEQNKINETLDLLKALMIKSKEIYHKE